MEDGGDAGVDHREVEVGRGEQREPDAQLVDGGGERGLGGEDRADCLASMYGARWGMIDCQLKLLLNSMRGVLFGKIQGRVPFADSSCQHFLLSVVRCLPWDAFVVFRGQKPVLGKPAVKRRRAQARSGAKPSAVRLMVTLMGPRAGSGGTTRR